MRGLGIAIALLLTSSLAHAEITLSGREWKVDPAFQKDDKARSSISGAACVTGTVHCIAVNDEKKYAQFFDIDGSTLRPRQLIRLLPDEIQGVDMKEIDAEGVHYAPPAAAGAPGFYYVTGSHGLTRKRGTFSPSAFFLFRFPVDPSTGRPSYPFDDDSVAPQIQRTALLRDMLRNQEALSSHVERRLDECGVTVEGLAVLGNDLLLGLRAPSVGGSAFVVRVAVADLFKDTVPRGTTKALPLGSGIGVRDLAAVSNGLLILGGRSLDSDPAPQGPPECRAQTMKPRPAVWFWSGRDSDPPKALGTLPGTSATKKAESLLVLEETTSTYRVLVLFDSEENGEPMEFIITK